MGAGGTRTNYEILWRMMDMEGGLGRWILLSFSPEPRTVTHPERRDPPMDDNFSGRCRAPPGLRLHAEMPMVTTLKRDENRSILCLQ